MSERVIHISIILMIAFAASLRAQEKPDGKYGKNLTVLGDLKVGRCMDAAVDMENKTLYGIGLGNLYSFDISTPEKPKKLSVLSGLGHTRQIEVQDGFAYVCSREEGFFVIDVKNPREMVLVAHYDTLELGTGLAVSGPLAAVANRQYGIEILDVSNPAKPSFLGMARTGEAQSVFIKGKYAYAGVWAERKVVICDISNPRKPKIVSEAHLDGYGDGLFVKGNLCFAATGHHARKMKIRNDKADQAYGAGHGLEIFDVSDPSKPKKLSVLKFPVFYHRFIDMWDVQVSGDYAFVGDTLAGLFVVNVSNPSKPFFVANVTFPKVTYHKEEINAPVGGFAIGQGVLYVAGKLTDIHVVEAKGLARPVSANKSFSSPYWSKETSEKHSPSQYRPRGKIHSVFVGEDEKTAFLAASYGGVHEVTLKPALSGKQILDTASAVFDVALHKDTLFLAEGLGGFSAWKYIKGKAPELLGSYKPKSGGVFQMLFGPNANYALLHVGSSFLDIVDISNLKNIKRVKRDNKRGPMYRYPLVKNLFQKRYAGCTWHGVGGFYYDFKNGGGKGLEKAFPSLGVINGMAFLENKSVATYRNGYLLQNPPGKEMLPTGKEIKLKNTCLRGKPTTYDSHMYVSNAYTGDLVAVDMSDIESPKKSWTLKINGTPGLVVKTLDMILVPAGHDGLRVFNENGTPYYK